ncbi:bifunctional methylenetetrahydrofolate dehydrogenase/methenyltetrahydrofolate cyclohydrolase FolD [Anaerorhabdus sp.]|uniref:bifunctional methylenetetrahydrofolate dehydrogenase/methenyltetrahydrofolate cyclohydrolase FolD n=1 Tax=Anaerorhabdus sp. TaxID=1872524 RepID=UPI002FCA5065
MTRKKIIYTALFWFALVAIVVLGFTAYTYFQIKDYLNSSTSFVVVFVGIIVTLALGIAIAGITAFVVVMNKDKEEVKEGKKMATVIYGSEVAKELKNEMTMEIAKRMDEGKKIPTLCVILVGNNPASVSYVTGKEKACKEVGLGSKMIHLDENTTQAELLKVIDDCNKDNEIDGILVQLPLPSHLNEKEVVWAINPEKDVDGLHPINVGKLHLGEDGFVPCTPQGIIELLKRMNVELKGKRAVVIGRSNLVGNPVARLLMNENATVTICHSKTENIQAVCKEADILVVAIGKAKFVTKDFVKEGAYVIDVGVNRNEEGKLVGDVDFDDVVEHVTAITPVPKGVGPMTITMLLKNTIEACKRREG